MKNVLPEDVKKQTIIQVPEQDEEQLEMSQKIEQLKKILKNSLLASR